MLGIVMDRNSPFLIMVVYIELIFEASRTAVHGGRLKIILTWPQTAIVRIHVLTDSIPTIVYIWISYPIKYLKCWVWFYSSTSVSWFLGGE